METYSSLEHSSDESWITATVHYNSLDFSNVQKIAAPTLLIRASEPLDESAGNDAWQTSWEFSTNLTVVDVPGNHFTIMQKYADATAQAVSDWLAATL
jgi:hypothetical protein